MCEKCNNEIFVGENMVMLKDELWLSIANKKDILCDKCIEEKLGRKLIGDDLKLSNDITWLGLNGRIPCNMLYAESKNIKY